jgi:hypothetical protein
VSTSLVPPVPPAVYVMEHDAEAAVPDKLHVPPKLPLPLVVRVTTPVGVVGVPGETSVTVTVQVIATPIIAEDAHDIEEDNDLTFTFTVAVAFGLAA